MPMSILVSPCPDVALERKQREHIQPVEADVAVTPLSYVPEVDSVAVAVGRSLGEGAGAHNVALACVEPVAAKPPRRNSTHGEPPCRVAEAYDAEADFGDPALGR